MPPLMLVNAAVSCIQTCRVLYCKTQITMDSSIEPNLNGDAYRNMTAADRPPIPDKNLQFILIFNEKSSIVGGSNMTDRYWSGTVWYYNDISDFNRNKAFLATRTDSGVCCGGYLDWNKFVIGEDSGVLQVLGVSEAENPELQELQYLGYACQHDDTLLSLSVFPDKQSIVTGGSDYCIKVWNLTDIIATHTYNFAHTNIVTAVDTQPMSDNTFVSTSLDCEALMWDIRQPKPARSIFSKKNCSLTAASWNVLKNDIVAIGGVDGSITLVDIRKDGDSVLHTVVPFHRPVHKILFNPDPERSQQLACCCDDISTLVLDASNDLSIIYNDQSHRDFVRGLTWYKDTLVSCSWDDNVIKHTVQADTKE